MRGGGDDTPKGAHPGRAHTSDPNGGGIAYRAYFGAVVQGTTADYSRSAIEEEILIQSLGIVHHPSAVRSLLPLAAHRPQAGVWSYDDHARSMPMVSYRGRVSCAAFAYHVVACLQCYISVGGRAAGEKQRAVARSKV